jgi:hypothetical protein
MTMNHFNKLTPAEDERLALLLEECAEVIQMVGKILRHGYESSHPDGGPTNRALLEKEIGHVEAAIQMMSRENDISNNEISNHWMEKKRTVTRYLHHQNWSET